jgi:hypothetical protein
MTSIRITTNPEERDRGRDEEGGENSHAQGLVEST